MLNLNNKGWGLTTMLIFLGILLFALLLVAVLINNFNDMLNFSTFIAK